MPVRYPANLPRVFLFICLALMMYCPAQAQIIYSEYQAGSISFHYSQWPYGSLVGDFLADGPIWNQDLEFPEGQTSGCGGGISGAVGDTTRAVATGVISNPDGTLDIILALVTFADGPATGDYTVDAQNMTAGFLWIDDVVDLTLPQEGTDYLAWFNSLVANHKFASTSGTITVTAIGTEGFSGSFSGMMADPNDFTILTISNGQFEMQYVTPTPVPQASARTRLTAAPNPFNPQTTIQLSLESSDLVSVDVFDLAGHRITTLHQGQLEAGSHQWVWNGCNDSGLRQGGGVYFCLTSAETWQKSTKLVLVP